MKQLIKIFILIGISALIIYFLSRHNFLNMALLGSALEKNKKFIFLIALVQILICAVASLRYNCLLRIFGIHPPIFNVVGSTFVSNAIGQWFPGSIAFIELFRIGLMFGSGISQEQDSKDQNHKKATSLTLEKNTVEENLRQLSLRSKLTAVSLLDRLIGFFIMLFFSFVVSSILLLFHSENFTTAMFKGLISINVFSFLICFAVVILFVFSSSTSFRRIFEKIERRTISFTNHNFLNKLTRKIFAEFTSLFDAISLGSRKLDLFWQPIIYSVICFFLIVLGTYLAGIAISSNLPLVAILATTSIISIASVLPIGFAGIGGAQAIAAVSLSIFAVEPQVATSAQLLQVAVNLIAISLFALVFAKLSIKQLKIMYLNFQNRTS